MKRRDFIWLLGGATAWPLAARAQQPKMLRVGFVGMQPREWPLYTNFLRRMAELGYQEGRNFTFDYIQTPNVGGYDKSYQELAARKPDVFLAVGNEPALRAALLAAEGRPIAFLAIDFDPLARGYVAGLSRPGGNVTGIFVRQVELAAKRIEIAREELERALNPAMAAQFTVIFKRLGFKFVTLDLEGFRSGSMNALLPVDQLANQKIS